jgi:hypothetical protein
MQIRLLQDEIKERLGAEVAGRLARRRSQPARPESLQNPSSKASSALSACKPMSDKAVPPRAAAVAPPLPAQKELRENHSATGEATVPLPSSTGQILRAQIAGLPPLARTRFATDGLPVEWVGEEELLRGTLAKDVVLRDPLRMHEGTVPCGYTIEEALILLRCRFTALQRAGAP